MHASRTFTELDHCSVLRESHEMFLGNCMSMRFLHTHLGIMNYIYGTKASTHPKGRRRRRKCSMKPAKSLA
jgi:hypothetical protein